MNENRIYEIVTDEGRIRMVIPDSWRVTYGPVSPTGKSYGAENALRIYEDAGKEKQRAIFTGVHSFRDLSIPVQRLVIREKGKDKWEVNENGRQKVSSVKYERRWVAEDELDSYIGQDES